MECNSTQPGSISTNPTGIWINYCGATQKVQVYINYIIPISMCIAIANLFCLWRRFRCCTNDRIELLVEQQCRVSVCDASNVVHYYLVVVHGNNSTRSFVWFTMQCEQIIIINVISSVGRL